MEDTIIITNFTDPVCTWCWGSEPVLRKLETHYPGRIIFRYVMGGLVKDIHMFTDTTNNIGGEGAEAANRQIMGHWLEASQRHGMPVRKEGFDLFSDRHPSTYPQCIAYKAAQLTDRNKADRFLRRIREATTAEAQVTSKEDVLVSLASEVGLDLAAYLSHINDGSAEQAFNGDLNLCKALGVQGFPTFEVKYNSQKVLMRGYQQYTDFKAVIEMITAKRVRPVEPEKTDDALLDFLEEHTHLAAEEIRQAFNIELTEEVNQWVERLVNKNKITRIPAGNGYFVKKNNTGNPLTCDADSGICL